MSSPILLVLGAGNNVGLRAASYFAKQGFRVAVVSRSISARDHPSYFTLNADLSDPRSVDTVFEQVRRKLGEPNVVIYNAVVYPRAVEHLLDIPLEAFQKSLQVNTVSPFVAAQQAVRSFSRITNGGPKVFLYTGNCLNTHVIPRFWGMGAPKSATAHMITAAAASYKAEGYRFYYVDERTSEGLPVYDGIDGQAHAEIFYQLTQKDEPQPIVTFVKGKGIVDFSGLHLKI